MDKYMSKIAEKEWLKLSITMTRLKVPENIQKMRKEIVKVHKNVKKDQNKNIHNSPKQSQNMTLPFLLRNQIDSAPLNTKNFFLIKQLINNTKIFQKDQ